MKRLGQASRPVSFWRFAGSVLVGNMAAWGTVALTRKAFEKSPEKTQKTAAAFVGVGTFWLIGGLTWVVLASRAPD